MTIITRLIAHASVRYTAIAQIMAHPFFKAVQWENLRSTSAPFVPALDSELDTGYYDDFTSAEDMAKYAEVQDKQRKVEKVKEKEVSFGRGVWVGFTFGKNGPGASAKALPGRSEAQDDDNHALATIF